ncbi:MAG: DUF502 domain-containing protein [Elusimicrobia bacterium]|nr:DUF502 domain-containing protein [Elusimicrobiota bacterium]
MSIKEAEMGVQQFGRRLKYTLISGLFIVGPLSLTFMLLAWFTAFVDRVVAPVIGFVGRPLPGLGLVTALVVVLAAGMLGSHVVGQHILDFVEEVVLRVPVLNWLYRTIKQVSDIFSPSAKTQKQFVVVEYPRPGIYRFGFVTRELSVESPRLSGGFVTVFIPTNNLYIGDWVLVPKDSVFKTELTQQQGVQAALSAGASLPPSIKVG